MKSGIENLIVLERNREKSSPIYQQIRSQIKQLVSSSKLNVGDELPSVSDLARKLDVNYRTVKQAYTHLSKQGVIEFGAGKSVLVSSMSEAGAESSVGDALMFIRPISSAFCASLSEGVRKYVEDSGVEYVQVDAANSHENHINAILNPVNGVGGLLISPYELPQYYDAVKQAIDKGYKVVFVDRTLDEINVGTVAADHFNGGYQAASHLLKEHSRPVYYIGNASSPSSCRLWVKGWQEAMKQYNYMDTEPYLFDSPYPESELITKTGHALPEWTETAIKMFESTKEEKYSIFAGNDYVALGVYNAAEKLGLKIGEDVFVVGFGNSPFCETLDVSLTSIFHDPIGVGYRAAKLLHEYVSGKCEGSVNLILPTKLEVRESSVSKAAKQNCHSGQTVDLSSQ